MKLAKPYDVTVDVGGVQRVKSVWAYSAEDAMYQAVLQSKRENGVFNVLSIAPPAERRDTANSSSIIRRFFRRL